MFTFIVISFKKRKKKIFEREKLIVETILLVATTKSLLLVTFDFSNLFLRETNFEYL